MPLAVRRLSSPCGLRWRHPAAAYSSSRRVVRHACAPSAGDRSYFRQRCVVRGASRRWGMSGSPDQIRHWRASEVRSEDVPTGVLRGIARALGGEPAGAVRRRDREGFLLTVGAYAWVRARPQAKLRRCNADTTVLSDPSLNRRQSRGHRPHGGWRLQRLGRSNHLASYSFEHPPAKAYMSRAYPCAQACWLDHSLLRGRRLCAQLSHARLQAHRRRTRRSGRCQLGLNSRVAVQTWHVSFGMARDLSRRS
jgi:hypothetical protein